MLVVNSQVMDVRGFSDVRALVVNSLTGGTLRILQGDNPRDLSAFIATTSVATVVDPVSGLNVAAALSAIRRRFVQARFVGAVDFVPGAGDTFQFSFYPLPVN